MKVYELKKYLNIFVYSRLNQDIIYNTQNFNHLNKSYINLNYLKIQIICQIKINVV